MNYQAVFFDFDGVILDSVQVKTRTFAAMFSKYGRKVESAVVDYHLAHGGVSRYKKFEYYYKDILKMPITQAELRSLGEEFSRKALQGVLDSPYIPGALNTLENLKSQGIPCFVASGTPDAELKQIVNTKGLSHFFLETHGSPMKKDEILMDIMERYGYTAGDCIFIGDAMTDFEAAKACETQFLGIVPDKVVSPFPDQTNTNNSVVL